MIAPKTYALCESASAGPLSQWHIRELTDAGKKLSGGIDTPSLCGHVKPPLGWDLETAVERHIGREHVCNACKAEFAKKEPRR